MICKHVENTIHKDDRIEDCSACVACNQCTVYQEVIQRGEQLKYVRAVLHRERVRQSHLVDVMNRLSQSVEQYKGEILEWDTSSSPLIDNPVENQRLKQAESEVARLTKALAEADEYARDINRKHNKMVDALLASCQ